VLRLRINNIILQVTWRLRDEAGLASLFDGDDSGGNNFVIGSTVTTRDVWTGGKLP